MSLGSKSGHILGSKNALFKVKNAIFFSLLGKFFYTLVPSSYFRKLHNYNYMYACNSLLNYLKIFSGQSRVTRIFSVSWVGSGWVKNLVNIGRVKTRPTPIVYQKEEDDNECFKGRMRHRKKGQAESDTFFSISNPAFETLSSSSF